MREDEDKHAEMIHFLRNNTQLSRFSRAEVRDLIERLDADGYEIMKKAAPIQEEMKPTDAVETDMVVDV